MRMLASCGTAAVLACLTAHCSSQVAGDASSLPSGNGTNAVVTTEAPQASEPGSQDGGSAQGPSTVERWVPAFTRSFAPQPHVPYLIEAADQALLWTGVGSRNELGGVAELRARGEDALQTFVFENVGAGEFRLRVFGTGNGLRVTAGATGTDGALVEGDPRGDDGVFAIGQEAGQPFRIVHKKSKLCLTRTTAAQGPTRIAARACAPAVPSPLEAAAQGWALLPMKKGACFVTRTPGWETRVKGLAPSWYYTWGGALPETGPKAMEFVPMVWGYWGNSAGFQQSMAKLTELRNQGALTHLLGFNEPDGKEQANLGVDAAVAAWPFLEATALRLGSPAAVHADGPWMRDFMGKVSAAQGRVDFVTAHWYGGVDADGLIAWLTKIHQQHGKPVWLTEFAPADWSASATNPNRYSRAQVESFMKAVLPKLDALPFLERYAWFSFGTDRAPGGSSALFENDGTRTAAGEVYRNHPVAVAP